MILLPRHHAIFVSQSRCCTETMYEALAKDYGGQRVGQNAHENHIPWQYRHWFAFGIVRNPYARAVSLWMHDQQGRSFDDHCRWLLNKSISPLPQAQWYAPANLTMALPFEQFPACLGWLPFWRATAVPHRHKTEHSHWSKYMTPQARECIVAWESTSFDRYGYSRDYPS